MNASRTRRGFTLIELLVVIMIVGVLSAFAVPQYRKSLENNRADDSIALLNMTATANRMYALDHGNAYTSGQLSNACNGASCTGGSGACELVACKYLAAADFNGKTYLFFAGNGTCGDGGIASMSGVACARRRTTGTGGTSVSPYINWGYNADSGGVIVAAPSSGAPAPTQ